MKGLLIIPTLILLMNTGYSQQISLQAGQSFSRLKFKDSQGVELKNINTTNQFYMMAEYRASLFEDQLDGKLIGNAGLRFNSYGSVASDQVLDNLYKWDISYVGITFGADYIFYEKGKFASMTSVKLSPEFLVRGSQTINDQVYNLVGEEDFDKPMFFARGGLSFSFKLTSESSIFLQYMLGKSYTINNNAQKLNILAQNFGIGLFTELGGQKQKRKRLKTVGR